jgi:hypothetical protein
VNGEAQQWIRWDPVRRMLSMRMVQSLPTLCAPSIEVQRERAYTPHEMSQALTKAGFIVRKVLDGATLRPADTCTPRLVVVAQKPAPSGRL